jgi:hypothetical protein
MNLLNWKDRADGNGSVAWTAHSTDEIERLEVMDGRLLVSRLVNAKGPDIGGSGTLELPRPAVADGEQGDLRQGLWPLARA